MAALRLLKRIESEARAATPDEQRILAAYAGWGHTGMKNAIFPVGGAGSGTLGALATELKALLTPEEYRTASRSTQYAHYTTPEVIAPMWQAARRLGFRGGRAFEPGFGVGRFLGMIPEELAGATSMAGVEMDGVSAGIARLLYPRSDLRHGDFVDYPLASDTFDLVIGNPPFSDRTVTADPHFAKLKLVLHDYFIAKSLAMLKPGGVGILVTSHGTMDKGGQKARGLIAGQADLLGAIRLPNTAFKSDAGTEVVTDILFVRKRDMLAQPGGEAWLELAEIETADGGKAWVNEYFARHPEMVLGRHSLAGKMRFGSGREYTVQPAGADLEAQLAAAVARLPEVQPAAAPAAAGPLELPLVTGADSAAAALAETKVDGGFLLDGDKVFLLDGNARTPVLPIAERKRAREGDRAEYVSKEALSVIRSYVPLRNAYIETMRLQRQEGNDADLAAAQRELKRQYDRFHFKHGRINKTVSRTVTDPDTGEETEITRRPYVGFISSDVWHGGVSSLERFNRDGEFQELAPVFTERVIGVEPRTRIETPADALAVVLRETGRADMERAAALLGRDVDATVAALGDLVYRSPGNGVWQTAQQYLSGNVRDKLQVARAKAAEDPSYQRNVAALEKVQPADLPPSRIALHLGMPIVPGRDVEQFMSEVVGARDVSVHYSQLTGKWLVNADMPPRRGNGAQARFSTGRRNSAEILQAVLSNQPVVVYDDDGHGNKVYNADASAAANEAMAQMRAAFDSWVWRDPERMTRLARAFNDTYNVWHNEDFDGSHLTFPGLSTKIVPYKHQRDLAWRFLANGNTYAVHEVGLGKTIGAILGVMEARRIGQARKPMIVVPNHMLGQWNGDFMDTYPAARVLLADEENFAPQKRQRFLGHIASGNYDAVIITHSAFKLLGVAPETERAFIAQEVDRYRRALTELPKASSRRHRRDIEASIERLNDKLARLSQMKRDKGLVWDDLGVDMLVVDEAHEYRKLSFQTTRTRTKGIDPQGSERAWDLNMKLQLLHRRTPGRNVLFLSGTPVVNTMAEVYSIQRMLQPQALAAAQMELFDPWANTFATDKQTFEKTAGVGYQIVSRLSKWQNMQMLSGMWRQIADYKRYDDLPYMQGRRPRMRTGGIQGVTVPETEPQRDYRERVVVARMDAIKRRHGPPQPGDDILLAVITDAIHVALDERYVDPALPANPDSKLSRMAAKIVEIWEEGNRDDKDRRTQIVFMDKGLPSMVDKRGFSTYVALKESLVAAGIPAREIAFAQDYKKKADKERLQAAVRAGKVRVLIGSTMAMGTGMNVQERLAAAHFVTIPWYPALVEQGTGRILRQGNRFATVEMTGGERRWAEGFYYPGMIDESFEKLVGEVDVYAYMTKGTLEEFMWGMNETKSRWIEGFYRGGTDEMEGEIDSESDQYALLKQMTSDDPRVKQLAEMQSQLARLQSLERAHLDDQASIAHAIETEARYVQQWRDRLAVLETLPPRPETAGDKFSLQVAGQWYDKRKDAAGALGAAVMGIIANNQGQRMVASFGGGFEVWAGKHPLEDKAAIVTLRHGDVQIMDPKQMGGGKDGHEPAGILQSLEHALGNVGDSIRFANIVVSEGRAKADHLRGQMRGWDRAEEMNTIRADIQRLQAEMAASSQQQPQAPGALHESPATYGRAMPDAVGLVRESPLAAGATPAYTGNRETARRSLLPPPRRSGAQEALSLSGAAGADIPDAQRALSAQGDRLAEQGRAALLQEDGDGAKRRRYADLIRRQFEDPQSPAADRAVRESLAQLELVFAAGATPYVAPAAPAARVNPRVKMPLTPREKHEREWFKHLRDRAAAQQRHRAWVERALADWSPENVGLMLGDSPDARATMFDESVVDRVNIDQEIEGGPDIFWQRGGILAMPLDESSKTYIRSPRDAAKLTNPLRTPEKESFRVLALGAKGELLGARVITVGLVDSCPVHVREVFAWLPAGQTKSIVVMHNHPSGITNPSAEDVRITRMLIEAGNILEIPVTDHIVTNGTWLSMRGQGLGTFAPTDIYGADGESQGVTNIEQRLAWWEIVPVEDLPHLNDPKLIATRTRALREGAGLAHRGRFLHVLLMNTQHRLIGVERIAVPASGAAGFRDQARRVLQSALRTPGVAGYVVDFNFGGPDAVELARAIGMYYGDARMDIRLLDMLDVNYRSALEWGAWSDGKFDGKKSVWGEELGAPQLQQPDLSSVSLAAEGPAAAVAESPAEYAASVGGRNLVSSPIPKTYGVWNDEIGPERYRRRLNETDQVFEKVVNQKMAQVTLGKEWPFPPVIVRREASGPYNLKDGHHRVEVAKRLGVRIIPALLTDVRAFGHSRPVNTYVEIAEDGEAPWIVQPNNESLPPIKVTVDSASPSVKSPSPYAVRESGVPYGAGSVSRPDGAPNWDAMADIIQRAADLERFADRRVEVTRAIERDRMSRLSREMQRLKRTVAKSAADKAAGKATGLDAARRTFEAISGGQKPLEEAGIADLMREALAIGRRQGRVTQTSLDLTRMLREALNARVKRLMGGQAAMPTDWRAKNAAVNRRMLAQLEQIETSIQASAPDQRAAAAAAELRSLFGLDKAQWTALENETRMDALGPATLLQAARKAIERDLRAYYRAEMTTLFGGRTVERRLPSGQTITVQSQGLARRGLRRMVPEQRRAMETLIEGIDFANLKDMPLETLREKTERAREILAEDDLAKEAIAEGHKIRREEAAEAAAAEVKAARPALAQAAMGDPEKGGMLQRLGWFTASQNRRALLLAGGNESGAIGTVLWSNLLDANERQLTLEGGDLRAFDAKIAELGFTRRDMLDLSYQPREVELADGRKILMTRGEMMTLYGMTLDEDARLKLVANGWIPARWRKGKGEDVEIIRGQGEDYDARLAASEAIIGGVVARLSDAEKAFVEWMVADQSREWARRGNETSRRMTGAELFEDKPHITLAGSIDREAVVPDVDHDDFARGAHMVDNMGLTKERQAHSHALFVRDIFSIYRQQARDMSVYTAWSIPFRDAMTLLSRGPALSAIVNRWGKDAVRTMKETLAYATYQKGHTDNWTATQKWFYRRERAAAGFILGMRASSAALNRYGGALAMAAAVESEGIAGAGARARFLARVFRPQAGMARLGVRERRAAYDAMMADGYLYDRWHRSPYRVFAQLASARMEREEAGRVLRESRSLARRDWWQRFQQKALSFMTAGEIGNGVDLYLTLRSGGMSQADAVRTVSRLTRLTQNPSTPLDETTQYTSIRSGGLGFMMPFTGQPAVLWNYVKAEHIKARHSGNWGPFRAALTGAVSATLFSVALRMVLRRASKGLMDGDDDDEKELNRETANTILDLAGEFSGAVMPGGDQLAQAFLRPAIAYALNDRSLASVPPGDSTLLSQVRESGYRMWKVPWRVARGEAWTEEQVEQLFIDAHRLLGLTLGVPTGGIEQAARVGLGLAGDPLGREPPESPGPVSRRRLVPPARRRAVPARRR